MGTGAETVRACKEVLFEYAFRLDHDQAPACADCFAVDGIWRTPYADLRGREEIRAFFEARPATIRTRHLWSNLTFDLSDPTGPSCTAYIQVPRIDVGQPEPVMETMYIDARDTFVREGGRWLILLHDCTPAFPAAS